MGCVYHPSRVTVETCEQCEADLCGSCAIHLRNGRILCNRCMVGLSVVDVKVEAARRKLKQEARQLGLDKRWRPTYIQVVLTVGAVLAVFIVGLGFYWSQPEQPRQLILNPDDPMSVLGELQIALDHYALAHRGRYPISLFLLVPDYLADTGQNRRVLRYLVYRLDVSEGFVLRIKENAPLTGKELVATANGIRLSGIELQRRGR